MSEVKKEDCVFFYSPRGSSVYVYAWISRHDSLEADPRIAVNYEIWDDDEWLIWFSARDYGDKAADYAKEYAHAYDDGLQQRPAPGVHEDERMNRVLQIAHKKATELGNARRESSEGKWVYAITTEDSQEPEFLADKTFHTRESAVEAGEKAREGCDIVTVGRLKKPLLPVIQGHIAKDLLTAYLGENEEGHYPDTGKDPMWPRLTEAEEEALGRAITKAIHNFIDLYDYQPDWWHVTDMEEV